MKNRLPDPACMLLLVLINNNLQLLINYFIKVLMQEQIAKIRLHNQAFKGSVPNLWLWTPCHTICVLLGQLSLASM